ncbi:MAG: hypothetical protein AB8B61_03225 [Cyclobacteriaceae bacterium]
MVNVEELNASLEKLIEKRNELKLLGYNDNNYDDVEDELHDVEDDFIDEYGEYLEDIFSDIHSDLGTDTDVLLPTAYIPRNLKEDKAKGLISIDDNDGVLIDMDEEVSNDTRLILLPSPARILFLVGKEVRSVAWTTEKQTKS